MARLLRNISILKRSASYFQDPKRCLLGSSFQMNGFATKGKRKSKSDGSDSGEENMSKKDLALKQAIDQINTSHGKGSIMFLGQFASPRQVPVVSTGSFALDIALGAGGFPKGRVVEIYGPEASGKITLGVIYERGLIGILTDRFQKQLGYETVEGHGMELKTAVKLADLGSYKPPKLFDLVADLKPPDPYTNLKSVLLWKLFHGWCKTASQGAAGVVGSYHLWVVHGQGRPPDDAADPSLEDKTVLKGGVMIGIML